jgi:biotin---protein ligase
VRADAIEVDDPKAPPTKIGGILSNCSFSNGNYQVVLGIGLNATNDRPTTSLNALLPPNLEPFAHEKLLASVLVRLEVLYKAFCAKGFEGDLESRFYRHWLHDGQIVTLESQGGQRARVVGITMDWGMLKVEELGSDDKPTGRIWKLQSDENSFDFWKGLVRTKS